MEKHTCKLCSRRFTNGRALGGHMRSHVATTKQPPPHHNPSPPPSWSSSSDQEEDPSPHMGRGLYRLRENPKRSFKMVDPEFSSSFGNSSSMVVQDGDEVEMVSSSVSDITTTDEDVAFCLMMLSRDAWSGKQTQQLEVEQEVEEEGEEEEEEVEEYQSDDETEGVGSRKARRSMYQCGTCRKVFRSYQALGGHRASHKKVKHSHQHHQERENPRRDSIHECPFCFRVFPSGQALGGHKRSHLSSSSSSAATTGRGGNGSFIDLNLPAPMEDCSASVSAV